MKLTKLLTISFIVLFASLGLNIVVHELGHFAVASALDFQPNMEFAAPVNFSDKGVLTVNPEIAFTSYITATPDYNVSDALVAIAGPLANLLLAGLLMLVYFRIPIHRRTGIVPMIFIFFIVPAIVAGVTNLIPINPIDGYILFKSLT